MRRLALGLLVVLCLAVTSAARASTAFGNVDSPRSGATVYGVVAVQGWVLDVNAVDNIQILVDGACPNADVGGTCTADLNLPRVDVLNAFPTYAGSPTARPGFIGSFVTGSGAGQVSDGAHTVTVIATETDDPTNPVTIASIPVVVDTSINQPPFGWIDIPTADPTVVEAANSAFPVVGWAIDDRSVDHIDFLVDGQIVAGAV
ncbi:MAG TPA: hypothetical protein VG777_01295, partial [Thermoanaerobaculia bacterium]|nr:hypothetical protein [Thermoanaerobaculia bacterium]